MDVNHVFVITCWTTAARLPLSSSPMNPQFRWHITKPQVQQVQVRAVAGYIVSTCCVNQTHSCSWHHQERQLPACGIQQEGLLAVQSTTHGDRQHTSACKCSRANRSEQALAPGPAPSGHVAHASSDYMGPAARCAELLVLLLSQQGEMGAHHR